MECSGCMQVMSLRRGVELALDAARGLAYMHNRKPAPIVHRDLKPANLMISGALTQVCAFDMLYYIPPRQPAVFVPGLLGCRHFSFRPSGAACCLCVCYSRVCAAG